MKTPSLICWLVFSLLTPFSAIGENCPAFPPAPAGDTIVHVSTPVALSEALRNASAHTSISLATGTYSLSSSLYINTPYLSIRSASGNAEDVVLDANYQGGSIVEVSAERATLANFTIRRAHYHPIHLVGGAHHATIYNLRIFDGRQQFLKANPSGGDYTDRATVACSHFELTSAGREHIHNNPTPGYPCYTGGIDAHQSWGWVVKDNTFKNIHCTNGGLAEHCIHFWRTSRDPIVERNQIIGCARGIGFGLGSDGGHRTYSPDPLEGTGVVAGHIGGVIRNNMIFADIGTYYDSGIGLEQAWNVRVEHNTIYSAEGSYNVAIDSRFQHTNPVIQNNIYYPRMNSRNNATPTETNNLLATSALFIDLAEGNLRLRQDATSAIDKAIASDISDDFEGDSRGSKPDIGADEWTSGDDPAGKPSPPLNLRTQDP